MADDVARRLAEVRERIRSAGGDPTRITVLGVTKGQPVETIDHALAAGLRDIGENYAQELVAKHAQRPTQELRWHMIGSVQTNKVKALAPIVDLWHSVDRRSLVDELARRASGARVLVQVNISAEDSKAGVSADAAPALVETAAAAGLEVAGLMGVAASGPSEVVAPQLASLRALVDRLGLAECSMGMSDDLELAVGEGATIVRVGRALFGPRPPAPGLRN